jgi:hypothetical protein
MADQARAAYEDTASLAAADVTANVDPMARLEALRRYAREAASSLSPQQLRPLLSFFFESRRD